mgnify:CR=1 FL=1|jgi:hypothetical protein
MRKPISVIINWSGPYSFDEAKKLKKQGIYLAYGRNRLGRDPSDKKLLYCGISERSVGIRIREHKNAVYNHPSNEWWIGRQVFPVRKSRETLEWAEWVITYFFDPSINTQKKLNPPPAEIYLVNEWFFKTGDRRRLNHIGIMHFISDVICWSPVTNKVGRGNLSTWEN